jgi:hypothetical protein
MKKMLLIVLCISLLASVAQASPMPVSYWEMEDTGIVASDTMGRNDGGLVNLDFVTDAVAGRVAGSQALYFGAEAATNDHVLIPASTSMNSYTAMSFMCWVKLDPTTASYPVFVSSEGSDGSGMATGFTTLTFGGYPNYSAYTGDGLSAGSVGLNSGVTVPQGEWHMLSYTNDGSNVSLYIDNSPVAGPMAVNTPAPGDAPMLLGNSFLFGNVRYMVGAMDEAAFWDVGLSANDIAEIYANGVTIPEPATMALLGLGALALLRKRR